MTNDIWDIMICKSDLLDNYNRVLALLDESDFLEKPEMDYDMVNKENCSAQNDINNMLQILFDHTHIDVGDASILSVGMLTKNGVLETDILIDILLPNLYCTLLLEAQQKEISNENALTLQKALDLTTNLYQNIEYANLARTLSNSFPNILLELFSVQQEAKGKPYGISTNYPELFIALVNFMGISPLAKKGSTAYSYYSNTSFLEKCMISIAVEGEWTQQSFEKYYLFERLFRLNTKRELFFGEDSNEKGKPILSPGILGDYFYSSPLVYFPQKMLSSLLYPPNIIDSNDIAKSAISFLHFLISLSSDWFPLILCALRIYMFENDITSYAQVSRYLFPDIIAFDNFKKRYTPIFRIGKNLPRGACETYSKRWRSFMPPCGFCSGILKNRTFEEWKYKKYPNNYTVQDCNALREIQDTL